MGHRMRQNVSVGTAQRLTAQRFPTIWLVYTPLVPIRNSIAMHLLLG
jgi:hypothetical protein